MSGSIMYANKHQKNQVLSNDHFVVYRKGKSAIPPKNPANIASPIPIIMTLLVYIIY